MENKTSLAKSAIPYGIIFGVIMVLEFVISYVMDLGAEDAWAGVLMNLLNFLILPFIFILMACNNYKNKINGGFISFGQCIKAGVVVGVFAALVSSAVTSIIYIAAPEIKENILEKTKVAMAKSPGMTSEALEMAVSWTDTMMKPYIAIPMSILIYAFVTLILSLIVGAIVKKDNPYGDSAPNINTLGTE
jgi:hypothetical protein